MCLKVWFWITLTVTKFGHTGKNVGKHFVKVGPIKHVKHKTLLYYSSQGKIGVFLKFNPYHKNIGNLFTILVGDKKCLVRMSGLAWKGVLSGY